MRTIVLAESEVAGSIELAIDPPEELREWTLYAHFEEEKRLPHAPDQLLIGASLGREPVVVPLLASSATQWLVATQLGGASAMITQQVVGNEAFGGMMTIRLPRLWPCSVKLTDNLRAGRIVAILAYCHAEPFFPGSGTELYAKQEYSSEVVTLLSDPILLPEGFRAQITAILDDGIALDHTFNMPSAPATVELNQPTTEDSPSTLHILSSIALDAPIRVYSRGPYMEVKPRRVSGSWELLIPRDAQRLLIPLEGGLRVQLRKQRDFNGQLPAVDLRYLEAQECVIRLHDSHGNRIAGLACSVFPDRLEGTQAALFGESRMVAGGVFEATVNKGVPLRSDHMGVARCLLPTGTYRLNVKFEYTGMFSSPPLSVLSPTEGNFSVVFGSQEFAFTIESARMVSIVLVGDRISDTARWVVRWIPDARRELGYGRDLTFRAGEGPANLRIELEDGSVVSDVTLPAGKESLLLEIRVP